MLTKKKSREVKCQCKDTARYISDRFSFSFHHIGMISIAQNYNSGIFLIAQITEYHIMLSVTTSKQGTNILFATWQEN